MADTHDSESSSFPCPSCCRLAGVVAQLQQELQEARGIACGLSDALTGRTVPIEQVPLLWEAEKRADAAEGALAHLRELIGQLIEAWDNGQWASETADAVQQLRAAYTAALASPGERREKNED